MDLEEWEPGYKVVRVIFGPEPCGNIYLESCFAPYPLPYMKGVVITPRLQPDGKPEGPLTVFARLEDAWRFEGQMNSLSVLQCAYVRSTRERQLFQFTSDGEKAWTTENVLPYGTVCAEKVYVFAKRDRQ